MTNQDEQRELFESDFVRNREREFKISDSLYDDPPSVPSYPVVQ